MKRTHFTTRDELYNYLNTMPHDDEKTKAERLMNVQHAGASLAEAGWTTADEPEGLLDYLGEEWDNGYYLTSEQARIILNDIAKYDPDDENDNEILDDEWIPLF